MRLQKYIYGMVALLPVIVYLLFVQKYAITVPFWDDLYVMKEFVIDSKQNNNFWQLLFEASSYNEHRILVTRLCFYFTSLSTSNFDVRVGIWLANLGWVLLLSIFWKKFKESKQSTFYFLPIPYLLFNAQFYYNSLWCSGSMSNFLVILSMIAAFYALHKQQTWVAFLLGIIAMFSLNSGLMVFVIGIVWLCYYKNWKTLAVWTFASVVVIAWCLAGGKPPQSGISPIQNLQYPLSMAKGFVGFLASMFDLFQAEPQYFIGYELFGYAFAPPPLAIFVGAVMFVTIACYFSILIYNWFKINRLLHSLYENEIWSRIEAIAPSDGFGKPVQTNKESIKKVNTNSQHFDFYSACILLVCLVAFFATLTRAQGDDLSQVLTVKYRMYSAILLVAGYLKIITLPLLKNTRLVSVAFLGFAVLQCAYSYWHYLPNVWLNRQALLADVANFEVNKSITNYQGGTIAEGANRKFNEVAALYQTPSNELLDIRNLTKNIDTTAQQIDLKIIEKLADGSWIVANNDTFVGLNHFILLLSQTNNYAVPLAPLLKPKRAFLYNIDRRKAGFEARLTTMNIKKGQYKVALTDGKKVYMSSFVYDVDK
jgi:hypothetical protein